jgi:uracil-DNA glycosylase family 4
LFSALYRAGYANQPTSTHQDDGLRLIGAHVTAAVHCAPPNNQPTIEERNDCSHFLKREIGLLKNARVILVLGGFACRAVASVLEMKPLPKFGHGVEVSLPNELKMLCSYHPSQRNTFTQRLTEQMFEDVFTRTREMTGKRLAE